MKKTTILTRFTLLSFLLILNLQAVASRSWVMNNGKVLKATFTEVDAKTVILTNEDGKAIRIPVENIGVADRFHLHEAHNIPIENLLGGNIYTAEKDLKINGKEYQKIKGLHFKGEGYDVILEGLLTPNYLILHEKGAKPLLFAQELERSFFSHAYRHPNHIELSKGKRGCYLFMKDFKLYTALGKALVDQLRAEGTMSNRNINQLEVDWAQYPGQRHWMLPKEYQEKYNAVETVFMNFADKKQKDRKMQIIGFYNLRWIWFWPHRKFIYSNIPGQSIQHITDSRLNSASFCFIYGLSSNNDIRAHGQHWHGTGMGLDQSGKLNLGSYGPTKKWANELAKRVKSEKIQLEPVMNTFYTAPSNDAKATTREAYTDFGSLCIALGRFLEHDLERMFGVCKLNNFMLKEARIPKMEELPEMFGYASVDEMDLAFKDFILTKNAKMKP